MRKKRRRIRVIDRGFQLRTVARFLSPLAIAIILFTAGYAVFHVLLEASSSGRRDAFVIVYEQAERVSSDIVEGREVERRYVESTAVRTTSTLALVMPFLIVNNALVLALLLILGSRFSQRIAGPLYRIRREISRVLEGRLNMRIRLRRRDELQDVASDINSLFEELDRLRRRVSQEDDSVEVQTT
jgi:nitrogen fixation/metabolism regulation signal transduction histidine kinase